MTNDSPALTGAEIRHSCRYLNHEIEERQTATAASSSGLSLAGWLRWGLSQRTSDRLYKPDAALGYRIMGDLENGAAGAGAGSRPKPTAAVSLRRAGGYSSGRP